MMIVLRRSVLWMEIFEDCVEFIFVIVVKVGFVGWMFWFMLLLFLVDVVVCCCEIVFW